MTHEELCRKEQPELVKLIDEGRLVYLSCKVGDDIYYNTYIDNGKTSIGIKPHKIKRVKIGFCTEGADIPEREIGKTVFLTREEAEKALKEREINGK